MGRTARASQGNVCYHVLSRGNRRAEVFHHEGDYAAFVRLLRQACAKVPMRVLALCLMPNHFHLALWPPGAGDLSDWMQWLLTAQVRRYQRLYRSSGHVWQGRFKAFPIQEDDHLLTVLRTIERKPLRAELVGRAEEWRWSSLGQGSEAERMPWLDGGPVPRPADWMAWVNAPQTEAELARLRHSVQRGTPYGAEPWVRQTAAWLGLESTLREPGRPVKSGSLEIDTANPPGRPGSYLPGLPQIRTCASDCTCSHVFPSCRSTP